MTGYTRDITVSNSIIAEGLNCSVHKKGCHSKGVMIGEDNERITLYRNLLANNYDRNPHFKPGSKGEFVRNVVYNWGESRWDVFNVSDTKKTGKGALLNIIGNLYIPGPKSAAKWTSIYGVNPASKTRLYVKSNIGPGRYSNGGDDWNFSGLPVSPFRSLTPPIPLSNITLGTADGLLQEVLAKSGSWPKNRNSLDRRVIQEVLLNTGTFKDCVSGCGKSGGGWPTYAVNARSLTTPTNPNAVVSGGYTALEKWIHGF